MMLKILFKKKLWEFQASKGFWALGFLLVLSFLPLLRFWFDSLESVFLPLGVLLLFMGSAVFFSAVWAFQDDYANQSPLFLEYLPIKRRAIWFANYLSGLVLLCLSAILLLWLETLLFPWFFDWNVARDGVLSETREFAHLNYLCPSRSAAIISGGSFLFWMYSILIFPPTFLRKKDQQAPNPIGGLMMIGAISGMPITLIATLQKLGVTPSGLALSPVLLASGLLFSFGSYATYALVPKHLSPAKRDLLGVGFLGMIFAVLVGLLYLHHLSWRSLDTTLPLTVEHIYLPQYEGDPNLLLADVESVRSGMHCVSIDVEKAAFRDLGRGLQFLNVTKNKNGALYFAHPSNISRSNSTRYCVSMATDGKVTNSFKIPGELSYGFVETLRLIPEKSLCVYIARIETQAKPYKENCLCVVNLKGELLKKYRIGGGSFLMNDNGQALALASEEDCYAGKSQDVVKPYTLIELETGAIRRFALPGDVLCFSKDLKHVICSRARHQNGQCYKSLVLLELSTMNEKQLLGEDELPVEAIKSQIDLTPRPCIDASGNEHLVNNTFDVLLWVKQRVDGDFFRYSILKINLSTGIREIVVSESSLPAIPVVARAGTGEIPVVKDFTADEAGFTYEIGPKIYLCDIKSRQSELLADLKDYADAEKRGVPASSLDETNMSYKHEYSPSGRRVLRYENKWTKQTNGPRRHIAAIDVFQSGKPKRIFESQQPITRAIWLDNERIVFTENEKIYLLQTTGGTPQQLFPPIIKPNSQD